MEKNLSDILRILDHDQRNSVVRDVLNKTEGLNLEYPDSKFETSGRKPALIQRSSKGNKIEIICGIKSDLFIDGDVGWFMTYSKVYSGVNFILVVLKKIPQAKRRSFLDHRAFKEIATVTLFDIDDIVNRIQEVPAIREKLSSIYEDTNKSDIKQQPNESQRERRQKQRTGRSDDKMEPGTTDPDESLELKHALSALSEITGEEITTEDLLENIFSKFCIGK